MTKKPSLPIDQVVPKVITHLRDTAKVVIVAPPGAGKSTRIPPAIVDHLLEKEQKILVLQPRRVAARSTAARIAAERGVKLGEEVGYRIRHENRTRASTRIVVLTEGLLTRILQSDPLLEGVGCVVFDEFHERSMNADLGLAIVAEIQREVRPDLKIVVMSATMDPGPVADWLDAPVVESDGHVYPVQVEYAPSPDERPIHQRASAAVRSALEREAEGDILVFLPGVGEIERTRNLLGSIKDVTVLPLYSALNAREQDRALNPILGRKVVLATNIAETSVTIPGITVVIDSGLARIPVFDPVVGTDRLELTPISRAAADQRTGRAGRLAPGSCKRLWTELEHRSRSEQERPEISRLDLTSTYLQVRAWSGDPRFFGWFEAPPMDRREQAERVLAWIGATENGQLTPIGRSLSGLPVHPRMGRVVIEGHRTGCLEEAACFAALASERDIFTRPVETSGESDLALRMEALSDFERGRPWPECHRNTARRVAQTRDQLINLARRLLGDRSALEPSTGGALQALIAGFPDRVGKRREDGSKRFILANGAGAETDEFSAVRDAPLIIAVGLRAARRGARATHRITMASAIEPSWLDTTDVLRQAFDPELESVVQRWVTYYLTLELASYPADTPIDPELSSQLLAQAAMEHPVRGFGIGEDSETTQLLARLRWLSTRAPKLNLPMLHELDQGGDVTDFVSMVCYGKRSFAELRKAHLAPLILSLLSREQREALDKRSPAQYELPDGVTREFRYSSESPPILSTRFERLFGLAETPMVDGEPVLLELLAPNKRPVQMTRDLASFWATGYPAVRKELRGRYPKHPWPDDPLTATPGTRRNRKGT